MKQKIAEIIGKYGCYYLCLIYLAEKIAGKTFDPIHYYTRLVELSYMEKDCFVKYPALVLRELTEKDYSVVHAPIHYTPKKDELVITRYEWKQTMTTLAHFVVGDSKKIEYDPLGESNTIKNGKPVSYRIIREVA